MTADAWNWSEAERKGRVVIEQPLRPQQMLDAHGMDRTHRCGDCRHYVVGPTLWAGKCRLSLRGSPASAGYRWRGDWVSCGAFQTRVVVDEPEEAVPNAQLTLPPGG
jgi:hypothetical protein